MPDAASEIRLDTGQRQAARRPRPGRCKSFVIRIPVPTALVPTAVPTFLRCDRRGRDQLHERYRRLARVGLLVPELTFAIVLAWDRADTGVGRRGHHLDRPDPGLSGAARQRAGVGFRPMSFPVGS
jgi:hypothetical protein